MGLVTGLILLYYSFQKNRINIYLSFAFLSLSIAMFFGLLIRSGLMVHLPQLYRIGNVFALLFIPLPYLYVLTVTRGSRFKKRCLLHFLPALIYLIDYFPVFLLPTSEKLELIKLEISDPSLFIDFNQTTFFFKGFHLIGRTVLVNIYWVFQVIELKKWRRKTENAILPYQQQWYNWMLVFIVLQFFIFSPFYISFFLEDKSWVFFLVHFTASMSLLLGAFSIYFYPNLLYGLNIENTMVLNTATKIEKNQKEKKVPGVEDSKLKEIGGKIKACMDVKKVYLYHQYSIQDLSRDIDVPYYQVSGYINNTLNSSFHDLLNQKRIEHCVSLIQNEEFKNYTLEALAKECGFYNRNTFIKAFKQFQGITPSEFKKQLKKTPE